MAGYGGVDDPIPTASDRLSDQASDPLILAEVESNDTISQAMALPLGFGPDESTAILVNGSLSTTDLSDLFEVELDGGDVISVGMSGTAERVALRDARGVNLMSSVYNAGRVAPDSSPVAGVGRAALSWVVTTPGTYYVDVFDGTGDYFLDLQILRAGLVDQPIGSHQILYLDFDGAQVDTSEFVAGGDVRTLSPLTDFMSDWGLDPVNDLDAVIDVIVATVEVRQSGINGDYDATGIAGQYDIESHKTQMVDLDTRGDVYNLTVRAFDEVLADASEGGYDKAKLHDTVGDDLFEASGKSARMSTMKTETELLYEAIDFEFVKAYRSEGADQADESDQIDFDLYYDGEWQ